MGGPPPPGSSGAPRLEAATTGGGPLALPAQEEVAAPDSWEECPDLFDGGEALGAPGGPLESLPGEGPLRGPPLPPGPVGPLQVQQEDGAEAPSVQHAARPDAWVHELLRERAGGPPALDKKRAREILGLPEEGAPPNATGALSPQYLAFLNFLYEDITSTGAPGPCEAGGPPEALSLSASVHFELLQLKQRRRGDPPARGSSEGSTAAALRELLRDSTAQSWGAPKSAPLSRPLREALMSLPTCCSDPREDQGPSRGPPCRPPPAGILGALQSAGSILNTPGGPLLLHRASTREGQQSFVRGLWGALPSALEAGDASTTEGAPQGKLAGRSTPGSLGGPRGEALGGPPSSGLLPGYPQIRVPPAPHLRLLARHFCPPKKPQQQRQQQQHQQQQQQQRLQWLRRWHWGIDLLLLRLRESLSARRQCLRHQRAAYRRQARSMLPRARSSKTQAGAAAAAEAAAAAAAAAAAQAEAAAAEEALLLLDADPQDETFAYDFEDEEARGCGGLRLSAEETAAIEEEIQKAQGLRLLVSKPSPLRAAAATAKQQQQQQQQHQQQQQQQQAVNAARLVVV
ncbi:hypothetical protein ACSSS7_003876 [Eimeria intestinalis]